MAFGHQTIKMLLATCAEGEWQALRHDEKFMYVSAWEYISDSNWQLTKEELNYEVVKPSQRSYK